VIISAHGVSNKVKEKAYLMNLNVIDTTCPDVKKVHDSVLKYLNDDYEVLYIGKENHPEALGVLEESNKIHLIDNLSKLDSLDKNKKYYITNQTTLAHSYIEIYHAKIKKEFKKYIIENNVCLATTKRETALYNINTDLIVVVGDKNSSNTQKLVETAKKMAQANAVIAIERANDLLNYNLAEFKEAYVTSGASTPNVIVEQVIKFLESDGKDLKILDEELFFF
jgi:4-hydroxy-3-methylbut-2-enyl diphosphate reductase